MNPYLTPVGRALVLCAVGFVVIGALFAQWVLVGLGAVLIALVMVAYHVHLGEVLVLERRLVSATPSLRDEGTLVRGKAVGIDVVLSNHADVLLPSLRIEAHVASGLKILSEPTRALLPGRSEHALSIDVVAKESGRWLLHGFEATVQDRLGLFEVKEYIPAPLPMTFIPKIQRRLRRMSRRSKMAQERVGLHRVTQRGYGLELREIRDMQPGDPFKSIAWKASARLGRPMVREYESELVQNTYICLDISSTMRGGYLHSEEVATKLEHGLALTCEIAEHSLQVGDRVGLVTFDDQVYGHIRSGTGAGTMRNILQHLVATRHVADEELTEYNDLEVLELVARYLLVHERLDFRRKEKWRGGVGQGLDYWSFARDWHDYDGSLYDIELVYRWLEKTLPKDEERLGATGLRTGVLEHDALGPLRRFCLLRGIELPYRSETRLGHKERGIVQGLESVLAHTRDSHLIVLVTDLCGVMNPDLLARGVRLALSRKHQVIVVVPFTPDYVSDGPQNAGHFDTIKAIFTEAEDTERRHIARSLQKLGVPVVRMGPQDTLATLLPKMQMRRRRR